MPKPRAKTPKPVPKAEPKPPSAPSTRRFDWLIYLALLVATFAVYAPVRHFDFVNYEWALTSRDAANWFPVTWVSHMIDCQLFGLEAGWHHLDNLLLHALAAVLLCIFVQRAALVALETW